MDKLVVEFFVRSVLIASATGVLLWAFGIRPAAVRHKAWTAVVLFMLVLPLWLASGSTIAVPLLQPAPVPAERSEESRTSPAPSLNSLPAPPAEMLEELPGGTVFVESSRTWSWPELLFAAYLLGAFALLARLGLGTVQSHRLMRRAVRIDGRLTSASVAAPITVGWFRPVVILPRTWPQWPPAQLEAVLTHERAHALRYDPLVQWLALLNRAVFWFHPLAWWLERRLAALAEEASDDAALAAGHSPQDYSDYLLDLARALTREGKRIHPVGVAMAGGRIRHRIQRIIHGLPGGTISRTRVGISTACCMICSIALVSATPTPRPPYPQANSTRVELSSEIPQESIEVSSQPGSTPMIARSFQEEAPGTDESAARLPVSETLERSGLRRAPSSIAEVAVSESVSVQGIVPPVPPPPPPPPPPPLPLDPESIDGMHMSWSDFPGQRFEVRFRGNIILTEDDRDVAAILDEGYLIVSDERLLGADRRIELRGNSDGSIDRRYTVGLRQVPYDPDGAEWLASILPSLVRRSGIGANARVDRILEAEGPDGVLDEIALLEGDWVRSVYFRTLFEQADLNISEWERALNQAGREISSDYSLSQLLASISERVLQDPSLTDVFFQATGSIGSDFEKRRVLAEVLSGTSLSPDALTEALRAATDIGSDFEMASLLIRVTATQTLDGSASDAFFDALRTIGSDFEHRRVLTALVALPLEGALVRAVLDSTVNVGSDFEAAEFLSAAASRGWFEIAPDSFFAAVRTIGSDFEQRRVLAAVAESPDISDQALSMLLTAASAGIGSDFELASLLVRVAQLHEIDGSLEDEFLAAARTIGSDHEQSRVFAALLRNR